MRNPFKSSKVQAFKVIGLVFVLTLELLQEAVSEVNH
jgi:hypothetical protein